MNDWIITAYNGIRKQYSGITIYQAITKFCQEYNLHELDIKSVIQNS